MSGNTALETFWWLVSLSTAFIFTFFIIWVQRRWGWATALFTLVTICFSQWITVFGRNLFWVLGAFYLPFVAALWYLQKYEQSARHPFRNAFWLMFSAMLLKCLFTGFEFITTPLIMAITPWIFYAIVKQWRWKIFLQKAATASAGVVAAVIAAIVWLMVQLSFVMGSLGKGFQYILFSFGKRTHGSSDNFDPIFQKSLDSSLWDVLMAYWNGHVFNLTHWSDHPLWQSISRISFGSCILFFLFVSILVFSSKTIRQFPAFRRQQIALTAMLWVSLLAPLSWFIIFKGHSYIHTHMNHIVWHMPFMLLGAVLTGSMLSFFVRQISELRRSKSNTQKSSLKKVIFWSGAGLSVVILLRLFVFEPVRVSGSSMEHTLATGDWVVVNKLCYGARLPSCIADIPIVNVLTWNKSIREADRSRHWSYRRMAGYAGIRRNDVVIFFRPGEGQLVKRVVGLPGDQLEIRDGKIWINDELENDPSCVVPGLRKDTVLQSPGWTWNDYGPVLIPEAPDKYREYFVLGDNRDWSMDSRHFGRITEEQIIGKASLILFPSRQKTDIKRRIFQAIQ